MNRIVSGSVWACRQQLGLQFLRYNDELDKWILPSAGIDTIVDMKKGDLIQFLDHRMRRVLSERTRFEDIEPIVTILLLKDMRKVTIGIKTTTYWENWWLGTFELVSK